MICWFCGLLVNGSEAYCFNAYLVIDKTFSRTSPKLSEVWRQTVIKSRQIWFQRWIVCLTKNLAGLVSISLLSPGVVCWTSMVRIMYVVAASPAIVQYTGFKWWIFTQLICLPATRDLYNCYISPNCNCLQPTLLKSSCRYNISMITATYYQMWANVWIHIGHKISETYTNRLHHQ